MLGITEGMLGMTEGMLGMTEGVSGMKEGDVGHDGRGGVPDFVGIAGSAVIPVFSCHACWGLLRHACRVSPLAGVLSSGA